MKLNRSIGLFSLTNIVIANMIGAGIFTTSGIIMNDLSNPLLLVVLWTIGGLIAFLGAWSYGEIGANFPLAGGEYIYLTKLMHPLAGFLSGWVSFVVGFAAPIAASSIAFSEYLSRVFDLSLISGNILFVKKTVAILVILIFTMIHNTGIKRGTMVQNILTVVKIAVIAALIILGFLFGSGTFEHFNQPENAGTPINLKTIGLSLLWILFAYSGWNASSYVGSEIIKPTRNLPLSLFIGTSFVAILYIGLNLLFVYAMDVEKMKGVVAIGGLAVNELFGLSLDIVFSLFIAFALLSSISAFIILGPRIYYSMAKNGHFFPIASYVNKFSVPSRSIIIQSALAIIYVISGSFEQILTYLGISLSIFPILTIFTIFKIRKRKLTEIRLPGYPYIQIAFLTLSSLIFVTAYMNRPVESSIAIGVILAGVPFYYIFKKFVISNYSPD
ncbi:MAG: amino acid permease [Bacteroidales bacterium]|nr:amino acid permease [Bacteroidales bacterium]